jgi:hypothetical protein
MILFAVKKSFYAANNCLKDLHFYSFDDTLINKLVLKCLMECLILYVPEKILDSFCVKRVGKFY